jgi:hypothetical protein
VSLTAPANGAIVNGTVNITATASDNVGVIGVQFQVNGANHGTEDASNPYSRSWNTGAVPNGLHYLTAVARDAAGNTAATTITVTVFNVDTTPPTVSVTSPANGATVTGAVNVTASAADNFAVAGVQFQLDAANLGGEDLTSPYSFIWDTRTTPDGSYLVRATARDVAGNVTISAPVLVTVSNAVPSSAGQSVAWTSLVNSVAWNGKLRKTGGCSGCADAAALSVQNISGDGFVEVTVPKNALLSYVGLGAGSPSTSTADIKYGFRLLGSLVEVRESDVFKASTTVVAGDVLRVSVTSNIVMYAKNRIVFYVSQIYATYPLVVDTALLDAASTIEDAIIYAGSGSRPVAAPSEYHAILRPPWVPSPPRVGMGGRARKGLAEAVGSPRRP